MSAFQSRSRLQPFFFKPCKRHVSAWKHSYWGSFLPQLSHNILSIYLSILMILDIMKPFHWYFYLIVLSVPP